jgi:hypothetical protein
LRDENKKGRVMRCSCTAFFAKKLSLNEIYYHKIIFIENNSARSFIKFSKYLFLTAMPMLAAVEFLADHSFSFFPPFGQISGTN